VFWLYVPGMFMLSDLWLLIDPSIFPIHTLKNHLC
jgi:hypothetical protein